MTLTLLLALIPTVLAITWHEAAHANTAMLMGDPVAWVLGRTSLNPFRHLELVGSVLMPVVTYLIGGLAFGWGKATPVSHKMLTARGGFIIALAGPAANAAMGLFWFTLYLIDGPTWLTEMSEIGVLVNSVIGLSNMLPIKGLDGYYVYSYIIRSGYVSRK